MSGVADEDGADETVTVTATAASTDDADYDGPTAEVTVTVTVSDCSAGASTLCSVAVGGSADGTFGLNHDVDWFAVDLESDVAYVLYLRAAGTPGSLVGNPTIVGIYDSSGLLVEGSANVESDSFTSAKYLRFVPESTGKYFVAMTPLLIDDRASTASGWCSSCLVPACRSRQRTSRRMRDSGSCGGRRLRDRKLGTTSDSDRFGVQFAQDVTYRIEVKGECTSDDGGDLSDPRGQACGTATRGAPTVRDFERVSEVGSSDFVDDNSGACNNALLEVRALRSGVYYVSVHSSH